MRLRLAARAMLRALGSSLNRNVRIFQCVLLFFGIGLLTDLGGQSAKAVCADETKNRCICWDCIGAAA